MQSHEWTVVVNPKSGNASAETLNVASRVWGDKYPVTSAQDVFYGLEKLPPGRPLIVFSGDGGFGYFAKEHPIVPADMSTIGDIAKANGFGRNGKDLEAHMQQVREIVEGERYEIRNYPGGKAITEHNEYDFCWCAGTDPAAGMLWKIEQLRSGIKNKWLRMGLALADFAKRIQKRGNKMYLNDGRVVCGVDAIKGEVNRFGGILLKGEYDKLWAIEYRGMLPLAAAGLALARNGLPGNSSIQICSSEGFCVTGETEWIHVDSYPVRVNTNRFEVRMVEGREYQIARVIK